MERILIAIFKSVFGVIITLWLAQEMPSVQYQAMVLFLGGGTTFYFIAKSDLKKYTQIKTHRYKAPTGYEFVATAEKQRLVKMVDTSLKAVAFTAIMDIDAFPDGMDFTKNIVKDARAILQDWYQKDTWEEVEKELPL